MGFINIFQSFSKKDRKFFIEFLKQAENAVVAAKAFEELVTCSDKEEQKIICRSIKKCETDGDFIQETIYKDLHESFITPFDRDDMHALAASLEDFLDLINDSAKRILIYNPNIIDKHIHEIAECISDDAETIVEIAKELEFATKNYLSILKLCNKIKDIEHRADDIFEDYMSYLFNSGKDATEIIKCKSIIQNVEETTDKAKELSDIVRAIIVKLS